MYFYFISTFIILINVTFLQASGKLTTSKAVTYQRNAVDSDIFFLLLKDSKKMLAFKMDSENDRASIFEKEIALNLRTAISVSQ